MFPTCSKLHNVVERGDGSVVAQCPACAALGRDSKGCHLVVYNNGAYGCIAYSGNSEEARAHRREVARLAGWKRATPTKTGPKRAGAPPAVPLVPWRSKLATTTGTATGGGADAADDCRPGSPRTFAPFSSPPLSSRKTKENMSAPSAKPSTGWEGDAATQTSIT